MARIAADKLSPAEHARTLAFTEGYNAVANAGADWPAPACPYIWPRRCKAAPGTRVASWPPAACV